MPTLPRMLPFPPRVWLVGPVLRLKMLRAETSNVALLAKVMLGVLETVPAEPSIV